MLCGIPKAHPLNAGSNPLGWGSPSSSKCALFLSLKPQLVYWFMGGKLWLLDSVLHIFTLMIQQFGCKNRCLRHLSLLLEFPTYRKC